MLKNQAVGIDLGTTYSCIAYLNEHGEPITLQNEEGELSTPSVVFFDGDEIIVGTEAQRNAIVAPDRIVCQAKRHIGETMKRWPIDGKFYTPVDISAMILKKLLETAREKIGPISRAVITVPAQFSDIQRQNTIEAGLKAGLDHVDIINEPVAAALCYVLGKEGLWFNELAEEQKIMVFDLGGGTFDLSVVKYTKNEVTVMSSGGDLMLGGLDWNDHLIQYLCDQFDKVFDTDPRLDSSSMQQIAMDVEQLKRSLSMRPKASISITHAGKRKTFDVTQEELLKLTSHLVDRTEKITRSLLKNNNMGWAHIDAVLSVGGSTRMPMVRDLLKKLSGRTLNTSLSPDQSIAHGAAYYAGMLLSNTDFARSILSTEATSRLSKIKQKSVTARSLGIIVRDDATNTRVPHYLLPANTQIPAEVTQSYGTIMPNQKRVRLHIVESGANPDQPVVSLGLVLVEPLPENLPENSPIAVTFSYDINGRVQVSAKETVSGKVAHAEIIRSENLMAETAQRQESGLDSFDSNVTPAATMTPVQPAKPKVISGQTGAKSLPAPAAVKSPPVVLSNQKKPAVAANQPGEILESILNQAPLAEDFEWDIQLSNTTSGEKPSAKQIAAPKSNKPPISLLDIEPIELVRNEESHAEKVERQKKKLPPRAPSVERGPIPKEKATHAFLEPTDDMFHIPEINIEQSDRPILLCNTCGKPLNHELKCPRGCGNAVVSTPSANSSGIVKSPHKKSPGQAGPNHAVPGKTGPTTTGTGNKPVAKGVPVPKAINPPAAGKPAVGKSIINKPRDKPKS
jgi:molecular chaperone DnaK